MGVFNVFYIAQMVPNRTKHLILFVKFAAYGLLNYKFKEYLAKFKLSTAKRQISSIYLSKII